MFSSSSQSVRKACVAQGRAAQLEMTVGDWRRARVAQVRGQALDRTDRRWTQCVQRTTAQRDADLELTKGALAQGQACRVTGERLKA